MLSPKVMDVVASTSPTECLSMIVTVEAPDTSRLKMITDRRERAIRIGSLYDSSKEPLLRDFVAYEKAGLRIVDLLSGTPSVIVSAPARVWKRLIAENPRLSSDPSVDVRTNEREFRALI